MDTEHLNAWLTLGAASSGDPLIDWLSRAGALGIMAVVIVGFVRGWIVPAPEVTRLVDELGQLRTERDRALELVYRQAEISARAVAALHESQEKWPDLH